ncbi:MAG TPA: class I adenylate-forming enzyme family protein [Acidimicrobiales bacterium]|nr:class I adenylate-forming enzyme family protein [Acidimicrobiales bacterium]
MPPSIAEVHAALTAPGQMFEMEEVAIRGIPTRTWKLAPPSLRSVLEQSRMHGDLTFLVYEDDTLTFRQHFAAAATLAHRLVDDFGVRKGDRVAIAMRNFPDWSIAFWAAAAAGAVVVPLNAWWTGPELEYGLSDSGSVLAFVDDERHERLGEHYAALASLRGVVVAKSEHALTGMARRFEDVLGDVDPEATLPPVELDPEDDATIFYTSGTTGFPKGALGTHRNICTNLMSLVFAAARSSARSDSPAPAMPGGGEQNAYLLSVPFFHATGCHSVLVANLAFGGKIVIMYRWDAGRALELIERERITTFGGVPAMVWQVLDHPDLSKRDISSVKSIGYGGAPAAPELVRRIEAMFPGRTPSNGYGLTETSSVTTMNSGPDYLRKPDSVGVPVAVCDVKVVDEDGNSLPEGSVGELWIKGPNVVKGYFNKPEPTEASFTDGWLHSGDVARLDDEGFVFIVDRAKDMVIRGGENVYCVEVEAALFEHPAVADAAVIGIPHQVLGEEVGAVVTLAHGKTVSEDELKAHVAERLAAFKVPVRIWFRDEPLPRNPAGKILKRDLRTELVGE